MVRVVDPFAVALTAAPASVTRVKVLASVSTVPTKVRAGIPVPVTDRDWETDQPPSQLVMG